MDSIAGALAAELGGADRIELCRELAVGGLTPTRELLDAVRATSSLPVMAMVRPRPGNNCYDAAEMLTALGIAREMASEGIAGVVFGALHADGTVDVGAVSRMREAVPALGLTFHRAFDSVVDPFRALDLLIQVGVNRVLTTGGPATAELGCDQLASLVRHAGSRIEIMAGGSVRAHNIRTIIARTGVTQVHFRAPSHGAGSDHCSANAVAALAAEVREIISAARSHPGARDH